MNAFQFRRYFVPVFALACCVLACGASPRPTSTRSAGAPAPSAGPPIRIASIFSMSGEAQGDNAGAVAGVKWAVDRLNAKGGVLGRRVELTMLDNKSTNEGAKDAAEEAVRMKVSAIIGSSWSSHSLAAAPIAQANHIPMVSNVSTHPAVTRVGDYIFRICFTDPYQGHVMSEFARKSLSAKTAVVLVQDEGDYSIGLADNFSSDFRAGGGRILDTIRYKLEEADFGPLVDRVAALDPDVLFIPGHHESAKIIRQTQKRGLRAVSLGGDGWGTPGFYAVGGREIKTAYFSTHWSKEDGTRLTKEFVAAFGDNDLTIAPAALAQDAVGVLADAMERAKTTEPVALRDALAATHDYPGITGTITLDEHRDPRGKAAVVMIIKDGKEAFYKRFN